MKGDEDLLLRSAPGPTGHALESTLALLARARSGDRAAASEVFERYQERLRRIVRVRLGPGLRRWTESGDVVQETCLSAFESIGDLELDSEFDLLSWLSRVATNRIRDLADHVHTRKREIGRERPIEPATVEHGGPERSLADSTASPSHNVFRAQLRDLLDEVLASLPETYREVVLLRDYQGADWPRVAQALGTPSVHAAQQLHQRAWIKIRDLAAPRLRTSTDP